jgi:hypothetical protein
MKKYIALLLTALLFFASGCAKNSAVLTLDPSAAADKLVAAIPFKDQMSPADLEIALQHYGLEESTVSRAKVYESTGATAEEVAVFEAKDETSLNKIKEAAQKRIENQREGFQDYQPQEMEKLKNPVLVTAGNYVFLCVSDDNAKAQKVIEEIIK